MRATSFVAALALASSAAAELFVTGPVATTVCTAGAVCEIKWNDDGKAPALKDIGVCEVGLYVGTPIQQTLVQMINPSLDVSTASQITFTPDPKVGEDGKIYFVRFTSTALKATGSTLPYQGFSARFELKGMTGTFSPAVQSQVDGLLATASNPPAAGTSPAAGATTPAAGATTKPATPSSVSVVTVQSSSSGAAKSTGTTSASSNSASAMVPVTGFITGVSTVMAAAAALGMVAFGL